MRGYVMDDLILRVNLHFLALLRPVQLIVSSLVPAQVEDQLARHRNLEKVLSIV
jgi:hypothetical protein